MMEDAVRAVSRARDHLAREDNTNTTRVAVDLDLNTVLSRAKSGSLASPHDVLLAIRSAWVAAHAVNVAKSDLPNADPDNAADAVASYGRLADALQFVKQCWLEEHLEGDLLTDEDWTNHVVAVNYKALKSLFAGMGNWSQRHTWGGFQEACREMRDLASQKTDGPYRTYARVTSALTRFTSAAAAAVMAANSECEDPELFLNDLNRWILEKWRENGLPDVSELRNGLIGLIGKDTDPNGGLIGKETETNGRRHRDKRAKVYEDESGSDSEFDDAPDSRDGGKKGNARLSMQRDARTTTLPIGNPIGGPLPAGASVSTSRANAVVAKVTVHKLQATVLVVRPAGVSVDETMFLPLPPPPPRDAPTTPHTAVPDEGSCGAKSPLAPRGDFDTSAACSPPPRPPGTMYVGPPTQIRVLTIAGVAVNEDTDCSLRSPDEFERHAFEIATREFRAGGKETKRTPPFPRASEEQGSTSVPTETHDYFRANALVYEREGVWVRFLEFEAKVVGAASGYLAVTSATPSTKIVDGLSIPGIRSGAVGGSVVGSSLSARDQRGDMSAKFHEMRTRASTPAGVTRALVLRQTIKALHAALVETENETARLADHGVSFGELGRAARRRAGAPIDTDGDTYNSYCDVMDRGIALASRAVLQGQGEV